MFTLTASASLAAPAPARRTAVVRRTAALPARRVACKVRPRAPFTRPPLGSRSRDNRIRPSASQP